MIAIAAWVGQCMGALCKDGFWLLLSAGLLHARNPLFYDKLLNFLLFVQVSAGKLVRLIAMKS